MSVLLLTLQDGDKDFEGKRATGDCECVWVCVYSIYSLHSITVAQHQNRVAFCYEVNTTPNPEAGPGQAVQPQEATHHA